MEEIYKNNSKKMIQTIKQIEYHQSCAIIKFTDGSQFEVSLELPHQFQISSGQCIENELFEKIVYASHNFECEKMALNYISKRMKSEFEIVNYLKKKKFEDEVIEQVVNRLKNLNYIDDRNFAFKFADYKMRSKTVGLNLIKNELKLKGIKKEVIEEVLSYLSSQRLSRESKGDDDLLELALKKFESVKTKKNPLQKVRVFLIGRGFGFDEVDLVLRNISNIVEKNTPFSKNVMN